jgi:hypothetical protein
VAVEQAVDEMQVARSAAARADRELTREMGLATGGKRRDLLVPDVNPFDLALAAQRVGQPVEAVTDDAVNAFDSRRHENVGKLIRDRLCHRSFPPRAPDARSGHAPPASDQCSNVFQVQHGGGVGAYAPGQRGVIDQRFAVRWDHLFQLGKPAVGG